MAVPLIPHHEITKRMRTQRQHSTLHIKLHKRSKIQSEIKRISFRWKNAKNHNVHIEQTVAVLMTPESKYLILIKKNCYCSARNGVCIYVSEVGFILLQNYRAEAISLMSWTWRYYKLLSLIKLSTEPGN